MSRRLAGMVVIAALVGASLSIDACGDSTFSGDDGVDGGASDGGFVDATASDASSDGGAVDGSSRDGSSSDGAAPEGIVAIVTGQKEPHDLVVVGAHLFWTNYGEVGTSSVMMANVDGSDVKKIGSATHANRIATDGARVFWTDMVSTNLTNSVVGAAPLDGGTGGSLPGVFVAPMGIAADSNHLYIASFYGFGGAGTISMHDKDGVFQQNLASALDNPVSVAADESGLAWTVRGVAAGSGRVVVADLDGGTIATSTSLPGPWGLTLAGANAYFTNVGAVTTTAPGSVATTPRTADASAVDFSDNTRPRPYFITGDATNIYWTEEGDGPANGAVVCAPSSDGSRSKDIATAQERPHGIAVDAAHVYWTSYAGGQIYRAPKPH